MILRRAAYTACLISSVCVLGVSMSSDASAQVVSTVKRGTPDFHVVNKGDTLYDLSSQYAGDSDQWPELWSFNPQITNPHWIYPGDIVYLRDKNGAPASNPFQKVNRTPATQNQFHLSIGGFVESTELKYTGRIVASPKQARLLAQGDTAWVGFGESSYSSKEKEDIAPEDRQKFKEPAELKKGRIFAIVRPQGTIKKEGDDEKVLGYKYIVLGSVRLDELSVKDDNGNYKHYHTAKIVQSWQEVMRGDLLVPYEQQLKFVQPVKSSKDLVAKIVDTVSPRSNLGEFHYIYVNRGAEDGVRTGNRMFIYQKQEGLSYGEDEAADSKVPWRRVGQVMLIDVRKNYSTAVITDSAKEVLVGDRLEMYKGF